MKTYRHQIIAPVLLVILLFFGCEDDKNVVDPRQHIDLPDNFSFNLLPTDLSRMSEFAAIGQVFVFPKAHGGFTVKNYYSDPDIPVYAMSDGVIHNIRYGTRTYEGPRAPDALRGQEYDDFTLNIYLSKTAVMHYGHLSRLAPEIFEEGVNLVKYNEENRVSINIKEGQIVAYIGVHPGFDIGFSDEKITQYFANPERYPDNYIYSVPFTDMLPQPLKNEVWEINPRTVAPLGGKISYDIEGTISGNWFLEGTTSIDEFGNQLIIAYHERFADRITISDTSPLSDGGGNQNQGKETNMWWIIGNAPGPENIVLESGKVKLNVATRYKFSTTDSPPSEGTVMFEMMAIDKLKFEFFEGKLPNEVEDFTALARMYER